jgi:hypothetical protein
VDDNLSFWNVFFLFLIFLPLAMIWAFALIDIFKRDDMPGWLKALWVVVIILAPFFGVLFYLIFRRPGATPEEREALDQASRDFVQRYSDSSAQQLATLADLHDRGKLTDAEFAAEKARVTASTAPSA